MMFSIADRVRIVRGMMIDHGQLADVVDIEGDDRYVVQLLNKEDHNIRHTRATDLKFVSKPSTNPISWPPGSDDGDDL